LVERARLAVRRAMPLLDLPRQRLADLEAAAAL
ncbi:TPA: FMN reductase, partial [Stenotrophomonas maltophilia]|nr:FMN reductase [Stenotrophomonas maltophilia]